jgi:8-oxo-dGTP pyrophosphatase MutT (NUDIX family)
LTDSDERIARVRAALLPAPQSAEEVGRLKPLWQPDEGFTRPPTPAAVLIAFVARPDGYHLLYTERSPNLRSHSGQIAFPGGKMDEEDRDIAATALREAHEEVALAPDDAEVLGYLPTLFSGTNYLITPVVALVHPRGAFVPNPAEVVSVFEVPVAYAARPENYGSLRVERFGKPHHAVMLDYGDKRIWGLTAMMTVQLRDLALGGGAGW